MSLSLSPANQNAPRARAWQENDRYKRANVREISLFAVRHRSRNIKIKEARTVWRSRAPELTWTLPVGRRLLHNIMTSSRQLLVPPGIGDEL